MSGQIAAGWNPFHTASVTKLLVRFDSETNPASAAQRRHLKARQVSAGKAKVEQAESASVDGTSFMTTRKVNDYVRGFRIQWRTAENRSWDL